ncbi:hypothetical protein ETI08_13415, partial [Macrococcoides goetzii]
MIKLFIILISLITVLFYIMNIKFQNIIYKYIYLIISVLFVFILFNFPYEKSTDYRTYTSYFNEINNLNFLETFHYGKFESLFTLITWFFYKVFEMDAFHIFILVINFIIILALYLFYKNKFYSIIALTIYILGPIFFSMSTNIIRQMLVVSIIILFLALRNKFLLIFLPFIHSSSIIIVLFLFIQKYINIKILYILNFLATILFLFDCY